VAAGRGHRVTLFEAAAEIGGQFNMAKRIPGKEEFSETLKYYARQLELAGVDLKLGVTASVELLRHFDEVILATGVSPRRPDIEGLDHPRVLSYVDVLLGRAEVGARVAIIGAGGIGFDVAEYLGHHRHDCRQLPRPEDFTREWGIDMTLTARGGVAGVIARPEPLAREIWLLQRKTSKPGKGLGKTTGWVHRLSLSQRGVHMLAGVEYRRIDDQGLIRREGNGCWTRPCRSLRGAVAAARSAGAARGGRHESAPDRRRRRGRGTGRQTCDQAGFGVGGRHVGPDLSGNWRPRHV
jgi:2,4-dienoyl-CoA reductase (NADPH2)